MEKRSCWLLFLLVTLAAVGVRSTDENVEEEMTVSGEMATFDEGAMGKNADGIVLDDTIEDDIAEDNTALEDGAEEDVEIGDNTALEDGEEEDVDVLSEARFFLYGTCRCDRHRTQTGLCSVGVDTVNVANVAVANRRIYGRNDCRQGYVPKCGKIAFICYCLCKPAQLPLRPDNLRPDLPRSPSNSSATSNTSATNLDQRVTALEQMLSSLETQIAALMANINQLSGSSG